MEYAIALHKVENTVYLHHWFLIKDDMSRRWYEDDLKNPKLEKVFIEKFPSYESACKRVSARYQYCTGETKTQENIGRKMGAQVEEDMQLDNSKI
jgi:hypothetical protein